MKNLLLFLCSLLLTAAMQAQIIRVPADYGSIQDGIEAANPGDTVLVSDSTYYEQINFLGKKPLMVASEFLLDGDTSHISNTIIDGSMITDPDSASVVYFISGEDTSSVLCGFTITGGRGTRTTLPSVEGGGIFLDSSGAAFRSNKITGNYISDTSYAGSVGVYGGGASNYITSEQKWIIFENNEISGNIIKTGNQAAEGGGLVILGNSIIRNNVIKENKCIQNSVSSDAYIGSGGLTCGGNVYPVSEVLFENNLIINNRLEAANASSTRGIGAGAFFINVKITCTGNEFKGNKIVDPSIWGGGGIFCEALADGSLISGNIFRENESTKYGGGMFIGWTQNRPRVENNYFFGNSARFGGALTTYYSMLVLQNNAFYNNWAEISGGAVYLSGDDNVNIHTVCLVNNSFNLNKAKNGGAVHISLVNALILNSVFWQDSAATASREISVNFPVIELAYCDIDTSLIQHNTGSVLTGEGLINQDPIFTDTLLNLTGMSPCINTGIDHVSCHGNTWEAPFYDIDNLLRPDTSDLLFDIGAHEFGSIGVGISESAVRSWQFAVDCYPNPTCGISHFAFHISQCQNVSLKIYDLQGREVAVVLDQRLPAGKHEVLWDASALPAGIYYYRLTTNDQRLTTGRGKLVKF